MPWDKLYYTKVDLQQANKAKCWRYYLKIQGIEMSDTGLQLLEHHIAQAECKV